jgi:hypothetical protein
MKRTACVILVVALPTAVSVADMGIRAQSIGFRLGLSLGERTACWGLDVGCEAFFGRQDVVFPSSRQGVTTLGVGWRL